MRSIILLGGLALALSQVMMSVPFAQDGRSQAVTTDTLQSPVRITLGQAGELLVSDYVKKKIFTLSRGSLDVLEEFRIAGRPTAIAFDGEHLFVGNESAASVEVFDKNGRYLYEFDRPIEQPSDIAIDRISGFAFVVATQEKVVKVFRLDGSFLRDIPSDNEEQLGMPTGVTLWA